MKKVNAREFQHGFRKHAHNLKPGQSVIVTNHGKPVGVFMKTGLSRRKRPNFLVELEKHSYSPQEGQQVIEPILNHAAL